MAIQRVLYGYLSTRYSRFEARIGRPPLDNAFRPKVLPVCGTAHKTQADPQIVSFLLGQGADPNDICKSPVGVGCQISFIWILFLDAQPRSSRTLAPEERIALFQVFEKLLVHGADPEATHLNEAISKNFTSDEAARLKDVMSMQQEDSVSNRGFKVLKWLTLRR